MKIIPHRPDLQQEYKNEFKENNIYPFNKIGRVITNKDTGEIKRWCNELDSNLDIEGNPINLDPNTEDVMVHIPAFYCKRTWNGDVLTDSILNKVPTTPTLYGVGYQVHPAFLRPDNTIRPYILVGAFMGSIKNSQLRSLINANEVTNKTIATMRDMARQGRSTNFNIITIDIVNAIQFIYKVAFHNLNSQQIIGEDLTNRPPSYLTGQTFYLGNRSGILASSDDGKVSCSLFGIESPFGYNSKVVDGIISYGNKFKITHDPHKYGNYEEYEIEVTKNKLTSRYIKKIIKNTIYNIADEVHNLSTEYYCDNCFHQNLDECCIYITSGFVDQRYACGIFAYRDSYKIADLAPFFSTRLCYLP